MIIHDVTQRSPEWFALRLGRLTGSCAGDMVATIKTGEAAARRNLRVRLVLERLTRKPQESGYESEDMRIGREREDAALVMYEAQTGHLLRPVGFCSHDYLMAGCSPDGLVVGGGMVEVKCPKAATHLAYLRTGEVPREYLCQCIHGLWITGEPWCDFVSYDSAWPESLQMVVRRIEPTEKERSAYELLVRMFLGEVDREYDDIVNAAANPSRYGISVKSGNGSALEAAPPVLAL